MKLSYVGGAARRGSPSTLLLLTVLGSSWPALGKEPALSQESDADAAEEASEGEPSSDEAASPDGEETSDSASADLEAEAAAPAVSSPSAPKGNPEWHSPLRLLIGTRLINRSFRYTDPLSDSNSSAREPVDYPRFTLPMPRAEVRWYPAGHFTNNWASQLGIVGGYEIAVGARLSYDGNGDGVAETPVSEMHDLWYVGGRGRIPIGPVAFGLQVDYAGHRLSLSGDEAGDPEGLPLFPDVNYGQVEIGADFEWRMDQLVVGLHGSYNIVLSLGAIGQDVSPGPEPTPWFPGSTGLAVDCGAYAGWRLSRFFDILVGLDIRAYGLDFGAVPSNVDPATRVIAGGATDRFMSAWLALAVKLPAKGTAPATAAAPAAGSSSAGGESEPASEDSFDSFD